MVSGPEEYLFGPKGCLSRSGPVGGHPEGRSEREDGGAVDAPGLRRLSGTFWELMGETPSTMFWPKY